MFSFDFSFYLLKIGNREEKVGGDKQPEETFESEGGSFVAKIVVERENTENSAPRKGGASMPFSTQTQKSPEHPKIKSNKRSKEKE